MAEAESDPRKSLRGDVLSALIINSGDGLEEEGEDKEIGRGVDKSIFCMDCSFCPASWPSSSVDIAILVWVDSF